MISKKTNKLDQRLAATTSLKCDNFVATYQHTPVRPCASHCWFNSHDVSEGAMSHDFGCWHVFGTDVQQSRNTSSTVAQHIPSSPRRAHSGFLLQSCSTGAPQHSKNTPSLVGLTRHGKKYVISTIRCKGTRGVESTIQCRVVAYQQTPTSPRASHCWFNSHDASEGATSHEFGFWHAFGTDVQQSRNTPSTVSQHNPSSPRRAHRGFLLHSRATGVPQQARFKPSFVGLTRHEKGNVP